MLEPFGSRCALKSGLKIRRPRDDDVGEMSCRALQLAAFLLALALPAGAEIYRWVDDQGREHFTADLGQIPVSKREAAKAAAGSRPTVNRSEARSAPARRRNPSPAVTRARATLGAEAGERIAGQSEEQWREEAGSLATEIEILENRVEQMEERGDDNMPFSSARRNISHRRYSKYRSRYREWERASKDLERARAKLERFEERARRSGVPPGWLR